MKPLFITGIDTDIGKTIVSAIITEKLKADYWKPIQSGDLDQSDTLKVQSLVSNAETKFHPEAYRLSQPYSPHKSAHIDGIHILPENIKIPSTQKTLVIEGAGGLMVPLNTSFLMLDLIKQLDAETIVVSKNYLGSINHTLLTLLMLKEMDIPIKGIVFNGKREPDSESVILSYTGVTCLGFLPELDNLSPESIREAGKYLDI